MAQAVTPSDDIVRPSMVLADGGVVCGRSHLRAFFIARTALFAPSHCSFRGRVNLILTAAYPPAVPVPAAQAQQASRCESCSDSSTISSEFDSGSMLG